MQFTMDSTTPLSVDWDDMIARQIVALMLGGSITVYNKILYSYDGCYFGIVTFTELSAGNQLLNQPGSRLV